MGRSSRDKGKVGERECAAELGAVLHTTGRRGVQYAGGPQSPDVLLEGVELHIECKRVERLALYSAVEQAARDAGGKPYLVWTRRNRSESLCIIPTAMLLEVARLIVERAGMGEYGEQADPVADGWVGKDGRP